MRRRRGQNERKNKKQEAEEKENRPETDKGNKPGHKYTS